MHIDQVRKIAKLSKLKFSDSDLLNFANQLTSIEEIINSMNEVDCTDVVPLTSVCDLNQRFREDLLTEEDNSENLFKNAPGKDKEMAKEVNCFIVPKVVE